MPIRPLDALLALGALVLFPLAACSHAPDARRPEPASPPAPAAGPAADASADASGNPAAWREGLDAMLAALAAELAAGDGGAARARLSDGFRGTWLERTAAGEPAHLPLDTIGKAETVTGAATFDGPGFVEAFRARFADWRSLGSLRWSLGSALFEPDGGRVIATGTLRVDAVGRGTAGAWTGLEAQAAFSAVASGGRWTLSRFGLTSLVTSQRPEPLFTDVAQPAGLAGDPRDATAVASADVDRDGLWDLLVAGRDGNRLYLARSAGAYVEAAAERGVREPGGATTAVFLDLDGDTDQDLLLGGADGMRLLENDGRGAFADRTDVLGEAAGRAVAAATVFDWDLDGAPDLFLGCVEPPGELLLRNVDGERFEDVTAEAGLARDGACLAVTLGDFDYDGLVDLYVVDPNGRNRLYHRERTDEGQAGVFKDYAASRVLGGEPEARSALFTDVDQDGLLDVYLVNGPSAAGNTVYLTRGYGWFARALPTAGGIGPRGHWSPAAADFDLDGRVDLFVTGGTEHPGFWLGGAEDTFADLSLVSGLDAACTALGAIAADLDDDGDADLFAPSSAGGAAALWRNDAAAKGFVKVQLMATRSWYEAAGATVVVNGAGGSQAQVLTRGSGYRSCQPPELVFGLGTEKRARVEVRWPGGVIESFGWVEAGTRVLLAQSVGHAEVLAPLTFELGAAGTPGAQGTR